MNIDVKKIVAMVFDAVGEEEGSMLDSEKAEKKIAAYLDECAEEQKTADREEVDVGALRDELQNLRNCVEWIAGRVRFQGTTHEKLMATEVVNKLNRQVLRLGDAIHTAEGESSLVGVYGEAGV